MFSREKRQTIDPNRVYVAIQRKYSEIIAFVAFTFFFFIELAYLQYSTIYLYTFVTFLITVYSNTLYVFEITLCISFVIEINRISNMLYFL